MYKRLTARMQADESGFTLIELLVVLIILGILAAVVVFSVAGIGDKGQASACKIDTRTMRTAEEAFFASPQNNLAPPNGTNGLKTTPAGQYATEAQLVAQGFLQSLSSDHNIGGTQPAAYTITVQDPNCGAGGVAGGTVTDGSDSNF